MPKLKQPASLGKMALEALHKFVLNYYKRLTSDKCALDELRQGVSIIKKHVCCNIPWPLLAEFCGKFVDEICTDERSEIEKKAALEILMDMEIVGLRCTDKIVRYLDAENVKRLRRLEELDLQNFPDDSANSLDKFLLNDLTTFVSGTRCTDSHLEVIGRNCPKLQVVKVPRSRVTDKGLRALSLCSELRIVDVFDCPVSYNGINSLLSVNRKIEDLAHWDINMCPKSFEVVSQNQLDSTVCPSLSRFVFQNDRELHLSQLDLKTVVAKFPNLSYLKINCAFAENLAILKSLNKLAGIEIKFLDQMYYDEVEEMWGSLKELLTFVGSNITTLKLSCYNHGFLWYQSELNFIHDTCPNLEYFKFDQGGGKVRIPPFAKLKELFPCIPIEFEQIEILDDPGLEFSELPNLETLTLINYGMDFKSILAIMLDDIKFPKLSVIETNCVKVEELEQIKQTAASKNLDFKVKNDPTSNWYIEYRFGETSDTDNDADDDDDDDDDS